MKLVCGVGVNDADYEITRNEKKLVDGKPQSKQVWMCPFYKTWKNLLVRCYTAVDSSYIGCSVTDEWLTFSNFKAWMEQRSWEGMQLDKDILNFGNKLYSPDTCVFISPQVNTFMTERKAKNNSLPVGVFHEKGRFTSSYSNIHLGSFDTAEEAHHAWLRVKTKDAIDLASTIVDKRVADALVSRYENYLN